MLNVYFGYLGPGINQVRFVNLVAKKLLRAQVALSYLSKQCFLGKNFGYGFVVVFVFVSSFSLLMIQGWSFRVN